jgi:hypothetical protein
MRVRRGSISAYAPNRFQVLEYVHCVIFFFLLDFLLHFVSLPKGDIFS